LAPEGGDRNEAAVAVGVVGEWYVGVVVVEGVDVDVEVGDDGEFVVLAAAVAVPQNEEADDDDNFVVDGEAAPSALNVVVVAAVPNVVVPVPADRAVST